MLATIDPIALRLGPISIHWYAICIVSGLLLAVYLAQRLAPEKGINPEHILDFILLAYGKAVSQLNYLPEIIRQQMFIDGSYRVPTFLYESLWNLVGFSIILGLRYFNKGLRQGDVTSFYLIWYGLGRFVIEGMRTDSLMFVGLRVSQWVSISIIILGAVLLYFRKQRQKADYKMKN